MSGVGLPVDAAHAHPTPDTRHLTPRSGVTLIELLITILIISILAAAVLGVAAVAGETAREARTRTMISRIHTLLMEHYDSYASRRVKLRPDVINAIDALSVNSAAKGRLKAEARLYALREMMLIEVPDRWSDVLLNGVPNNPGGATWLQPLYLDVSASTDFRTELGNVYLRQFRRIAVADNKITGNPNTGEQIKDNQGAECLYMVIMNATGDGEARTLFGETSIGDSDGDGAPEFLDGWGNPINFLRWAPGFDSEVQYNAEELDNPPTGSSADAWTAAANADHDPFDLYRVDPRALRLVPLIYSPGRDEDSGLNSEVGYVTWRNTTASFPSFSANFTVPPPYVAPQLNPYRIGAPPDWPVEYRGSENGENTATDNIHNHLIATR
jgi:prepilin-type N-terminal cleavage/methylation domain-containing protein